MTDEEWIEKYNNQGVAPIAPLTPTRGADVARVLTKNECTVNGANLAPDQVDRILESPKPIALEISESANGDRRIKFEGYEDGVRHLARSMDTLLPANRVSSDAIATVMALMAMAIGVCGVLWMGVQLADAVYRPASGFVRR